MGVARVRLEEHNELVVDDLLERLAIKFPAGEARRVVDNFPLQGTFSVPLTGTDRKERRMPLIGPETGKSLVGQAKLWSRVVFNA
jgi:hypothetical protein